MKEGSLFSTPSPEFIVYRFLVMAILTCMKWYLIVFLIWISLLMSNVKHLFMYLIAIFMSSLKKWLFRSSAHLLIVLFVCLFCIFWCWAIWAASSISSGFPWWLSGKESTCQCRRCRLDPWGRKIPWRRKWQSTLVFLPGIFHGQRSLAGYRFRHDLVTKFGIPWWLSW